MPAGLINNLYHRAVHSVLLPDVRALLSLSSVTWEKLGELTSKEFSSLNMAETQPHVFVFHYANLTALGDPGLREWAVSTSVCWPKRAPSLVYGHTESVFALTFTDRVHGKWGDTYPWFVAESQLPAHDTDASRTVCRCQGGSAPRSLLRRVYVL